MEAPVKLVLFPLVFIFPITFIVLAFPIVMKFMQEEIAVKLTLLNVAGRSTPVLVEVAQTSVERMVGLLGRDGLSDDAGLLLRPCGAVHTFGMRFAIDVVFLDRKQQVLEISMRCHRAARCSRYVPCRYSNWQQARRSKHRIRVGDTLAFEERQCEPI